jgi:hypothetical protein
MRQHSFKTEGGLQTYDVDLQPTFGLQRTNWNKNTHAMTDAETNLSQQHFVTSHDRRKCAATHCDLEKGRQPHILFSLSLCFRPYSLGRHDTVAR